MNEGDNLRERGAGFPGAVGRGVERRVPPPTMGAAFLGVSDSRGPPRMAPELGGRKVQITVSLHSSPITKSGAEEASAGSAPGPLTEGQSPWASLDNPRGTLRPKARAGVCVGRCGF